jgi:hypothetical protein
MMMNYGKNYGKNEWVMWKIKKLINITIF